MTAVIHINGVIGQDTDLLGVIRQFKSYKDPSEVEVHIDSVGGEVDEGMSIFNYLRGLGLPITTKANRAYSISASIFMAGDIRLLEEGNARFMIHMPWGSVEGGRKQFESASAQLKEIEDSFVEFYSKYTNIDEASVRRLLENETFMSADEALSIGIATGTYQPLKAVAFYNDNQTKEEKTMTKAEKLVQALASFISGESHEPTAEVDETVEAVALVLQDANGEGVEFPEVEENEKPEVGAKVMRAGEPVKDEEILMPDGSKIIVKDGIVESIQPADEPEEEAEAEEPEVEASAEAEEADVDVEALMKQLEANILEKVTAQFKEKEEALKAEIVALKKEVGSELDNTPEAPSTAIKNKSNNTTFLTNALRNKRK
jgi:ATP-dependent protease ClpP protease subunit